MSGVEHLSMDALRAGLPEILGSPADGGRLVLIVRRPEVNAREVLDVAELDITDGLVGDSWRPRSLAGSPDEAPDPATQITLMNARVIALLAQSEARWPLAGDQLFVDLDLSARNLPAGRVSGSERPRSKSAPSRTPAAASSSSGSGSTR